MDTVTNPSFQTHWTHKPLQGRKVNVLSAWNIAWPIAIQCLLPFLRWLPSPTAVTDRNPGAVTTSQPCLLHPYSPWTCRALCHLWRLPTQFLLLHTSLTSFCLAYSSSSLRCLLNVTSSRKTSKTPVYIRVPCYSLRPELRKCFRKEPSSKYQTV